MISRRFLPAVLFVAAAATACPPEPDPLQPKPLLTLDKTSALAAANANLRSVLVGGAASSRLLGQAPLLDDLASGSGVCTLDAETGETRCVEAEFEGDAENFADEIAARVLNVLNVEVEEEKRIVLKLDAERVCDGEADCIRAFNDVPVRIELTSRTDKEIDLALLVDEPQLRVASLKLYPNEVSVELDLGLIKSAMGDFLKAAGADERALPETFSGRVRFAIEKLGEREYSASFHVVSAIELKVKEPAISVRVEAASPAFSIRLDEEAAIIEIASMFQQISGRLPLGAVIEDENVAGELAFRLGKMSSVTTLNLGGDGSIVIENLDAGEAEVTVDGLPLFSFDSSVQRIVINGTEDGIRVAVSPSLVARAAFDLQNIADRLSDIPSWLMNEELTLKLEGAAEPAVRFSDEHNMIEMLFGSMSIHSRAAGRTVNVAAGQCLLADESSEESSAQHPIELLSAGMCR